MSLSIDTQNENKMASPRSRPNWCLKMEVIVTPGPLPTRVTKEATVTIPIVMAQGCGSVTNSV